MSSGNSGAEYQYVVKNELKLKGSSTLSMRNGRVAKKRKKKNDQKTTKGHDILNLKDPDTGGVTDAPCENTAAYDHGKTDACHSTSEALLGDFIDPHESLTLAEKAFRLAQQRREMLRTNKRLELTHRQRMERFNAQLRALPEHFDIPKVGPG